MGVSGPARVAVHAGIAAASGRARPGTERGNCVREQASRACNRGPTVVQFQSGIKAAPRRGRSISRNAMRAVFIGKKAALGPADDRCRAPAHSATDRTRPEPDRTAMMARSGQNLQQGRRPYVGNMSFRKEDAPAFAGASKCNRCFAACEALMPASQRDASGQQDQNVTLQLSMRPVSRLAASRTRRFHVPFSASPERFTLNVWLTLSALPPERFSRL